MSGTINLAYYRKKDWKRFIALIDDKESMHDNWKDWNKAYLKTKKELTFQGFIVNDFVVNLNELKKYCIANNLKIDGKARAQFVTNK